MKILKVFNLLAIMIASMSFIASAEEPAAAQGGLSDEPESRGPRKGALFIHGGGGGGGKSSYAGFVDFVRQVTSRKAPKIVVITTAGGKNAAEKREVGSARAFKAIVGEGNVSVLHTLSRKVADFDEFTAPGLSLSGRGSLAFFLHSPFSVTNRW